VGSSRGGLGHPMIFEELARHPPLRCARGKDLEVSPGDGGPVLTSDANQTKSVTVDVGSDGSRSVREVDANQTRLINN